MSNYFQQVPNFEYVSRLPNAKIGDYVAVKNFFKKGKLREDIFQELSFFTKYKIEGNDRPDNVAFKVYGDSNLDWLVLVCNSIMNIQTEWPLPQQDFDRYLVSKYGLPTDTETETYDRIYNGIHHYETTKVTDNRGVEIVPEGLQVPSDYSVTYYDSSLRSRVTVNPVDTITNYEYEEKIENDKRNIFLLKTRYVNVVKDDMEEIMTYQQGSTQYVSETLKRADNIKLYD